MFDDWRARLVAAALKDRETRARLAAAGVLFDGYNREMEAVHLENAALLEEAIAAIGWPGRAKVGDEGAGAAFLIAQHAISRPDLQRRALALVLESIPAHQANPLDAAYLADRIALYEGRPQIFGTQFDWDADGLMSPAAIADEAGVDEMRANVGLPPLAEAIAAMRASTSDEKPPADLAQRRVEFEAWARRVGWRA